MKKNWAVAVLLVCTLGLANGQYAGKDWPVYHGDPAATHYSTLEQITKENVQTLKKAWTYHSSREPVDDRSEIQCNPLVIDGVLYGISPDGQVFAVNAANGEERWRFDPFFRYGGRRRTNSVRGLAYWSDGTEERLLVGMSSRLQAIDPATGVRDENFGHNGVVDLRAGLDRDPERVRYWFTTPGAVYQNLYIVGGYFSESHRGAAPGDIRAYDVKSGELVWSFRTIPRAGEFGADTWPAGARQRSGAANAWAGFSLDAVRGLLFAPTGSPSYDFYGGDRIGKNLFGNSLIALKAATGERVWHYQIVHHDLWDKDLPAQPNLVTVERDGRRIDAVAQVTKAGYTYVFERETGEPLFPIEEVPVPAAALDGEEAWPTQPIPSVPPPFTRTRMSEEEVTDITPSAHAAVKAALQGTRYGSQFIPLSEKPTVVFPGMIGGAEWGGAAYNPQSGVLYVNANEVPYVLTMVKLDDSDNMTPQQEGRNVYARMCSACHGLDRKGSTHMGYNPPLLALGGRMNRAELEEIIVEGRGRMEGFPWMRDRRPHYIDQLAAFLLETDGDTDWEKLENPEKFIYTHMGHTQFTDPKGYPAVKPPWGTLSAIDLNQGTLKWQVPLGEHAELTARGIPVTGTENYGGPVITASGLLFIAATADEKIRAFDQESGALLWEADLPASGFATPSLYQAGGKQYLVIACGGGKVDRSTSDAYVAFALPD